MKKDLRRLMELSGIIHRSEKLLKEGEGGDDAADLFARFRKIVDERWM